MTTKRPCTGFTNSRILKILDRCKENHEYDEKENEPPTEQNTKSNDPLISRNKRTPQNFTQNEYSHVEALMQREYSMNTTFFETFNETKTSKDLGLEFLDSLFVNPFFVDLVNPEPSLICNEVMPLRSPELDGNFNVNTNISPLPYYLEDSDDSVKDKDYDPNEDLSSDESGECSENIKWSKSIPSETVNLESQPQSVDTENKAIVLPEFQSFDAIDHPGPSTSDILTSKKKRVSSKDKKAKKNEKFEDKYRVKLGCNEKCIKKCFAKFSPDERENINKGFWKLSWRERRIFLQNSTSKALPKRKVTTHPKRSARSVFHLKKDDGEVVEVCKIFLLTTLGFNKNNDTVLYNAIHTKNVEEEDKRGLHTKTQSYDRQIFKAHVESFHPLEPHYRREHAPNRKYLPCDISVKLMYEDFCKKHPDKKVSYEFYRKIVKDMNISFTKLGNEECETCEAYILHSKATSHDVKTNVPENCETCLGYDEHRKKFIKARTLYEFHKTLSQSEQNIYFSVDLQKVIMLPRLDCFKSIIFCPRLATFNLSFAPIGRITTDYKPYACIWHDGISGRKQEDILSCYYQFILHYRDIEHIHIWMDNCSAQNKNWLLYSLMVYLINSDLIGTKKITFNYFEPGHTFMSCDQFHHQVEQAMRKKVSPGSLRPVIVYIHGESFEWNSGNPYDGSVLASYADLVVITLNYRLGILGFLNANPAPHLKARVANYGLMDQIAALHWIQQNVALFGGDPNNVTLAGHGSGAACINFLMISPTVMQGLFHRTILLSGSALSSWALVEDPVNYAVKLAKEVNCSIPDDVGKDHEVIVDCLRETPLHDLLQADVVAPSYLSAFGPSVDGVVIKADFAKELVTYFKPQDLQNFMGPVNANMKRSEATITPRGNNPYDLLYGVVTSEALWMFSNNDITAGFEGEHRDRILRTYVRNAYTYHLSEIFFTIVNEYTDWERTVQHPVNTRDSVIAALSDAQFVAPLVQTGDLLSAKPQQPGQEGEGSKTFFYVFDYQTKDGDYPQRMGTVHGEELPYIFGAPLVDGFNHFPKNYTRSELALSESFLIYIANFVRTGNPNDNHKQEPILAASRERNRFRSIVWDEYDPVHQKYLEIGMKPRMKNHFRAHQLSVWLRLIPELHRAGMEDVVAKHNLFRNHNSADLYEGAVRPDPLSRISYYDPTMELIRRRPNSSLTTLDAPTTIETIVTTCVNIVSSGNYNHQIFQHNSSDTLASLEAAGYAAYSTALSVTIAIGCSLLILNVLIFAGVYYQRDKTRMEVKNLQQQQNRNQAAFETISKHQYHLGHSQSTNVIVDVEQDTSALILTNAQQDNLNKIHQICPTTVANTLKAPPPSPNVMLQNCMTLPKNMSYGGYQHQGCITLPKNSTMLNNTACIIAEMQQQGYVQPPNGNATMPLGVPKPPPPPRAKSPESQPLLTHNNTGKCNMRVPHAAMSEMRV